MEKMPQKLLKKPGNFSRRNSRVAVVAALVFALLAAGSTCASASKCSDEFMFRKESRLCGIDLSKLGVPAVQPHGNPPVAPKYVFRESGDLPLPSLTSAFYPLSGLESYSADMRNINIRIENYMMSLIFPLSSLKEQYDILKLLIEERKE